MSRKACSCRGGVQCNALDLENDNRLVRFRRAQRQQPPTGVRIAVRCGARHASQRADANARTTDTQRSCGVCLEGVAQCLIIPRVQCECGGLTRRLADGVCLVAAQRDDCVENTVARSPACSALIYRRAEQAAVT